MKTILSSFVFLSFIVSAFSQSDEINISASFAQSIELRVIGSASVDFSFSSLSDYQSGKSNYMNTTGFEVASSTSFEVQAEFTPFVNESGDELEMRNLTYHVCIPVDRYSERGGRWEVPSPDYLVHSGDRDYSGQWTNDGSVMRVIGLYTAETSPKTFLFPGSGGNAGTFEDNRFYFQFALGHPHHNSLIGIPSLLDQNIQPGTYTCTMTLTAIPSIT